MALNVGTLTASLKLNKSKFDTDLRAAKKAMMQTARDMQMIGGWLSGVGTKMMMGVTAPILAAFAVSTALAMKQQQAEADLQAALAKTGDASADAMGRLKKYASELQKLTIYGDEETLAEMAFGKNLGITSDRLEDATKAAMGLSAKYKIDLHSAMMLVGRASQGQTQMLTRYGIILEATLSPQEKYNELLRIGADNFGLAEAAAKTGKGQLIQLKNSLGDMAESIGTMILPMVKDLARHLKSIAESFQKLGPVAKKAIMVLLLLAAAAGPILKLVGYVVSLGGWLLKLGGMAGLVAKLGSVFAAILSPVGLLVAAIVAIGAAFVLAYKYIKPFREAVQQAWAKMKEAFAALWAAIKKLGSALAPIVKVFGQIGGKVLVAAFAALGFVLKIIAATIQAVVDAIAVLIDLVAKLLHFLSRGKEGGSTYLDKILAMTIKATLAAQKQGAALAEQKRVAEEVAQAEIDAVMEVVEKRRKAAEERRQQMREAAGFASITSLWEQGMIAGARAAAGAKVEAQQTTIANVPSPPELREIRDTLKEQKRETEKLNRYIREALTYA